MNADDNLREFKQYYPDISMSRELIFKCGCRHWREDITSRPMVCPDHCERVKYYLTTCPDCGRVVIRKNYSRVPVCGQCTKIRREVYLELHSAGCFEPDEYPTFTDIGMKLGLSAPYVGVVYKNAMKKLKDNPEMNELMEIFDELSDSETLSQHGFTYISS